MACAGSIIIPYRRVGPIALGRVERTDPDVGGGIVIGGIGIGGGGDLFRPPLKQLQIGAGERRF